MIYSVVVIDAFDCKIYADTDNNSLRFVGMKNTHFVREHSRIERAKIYKLLKEKINGKTRILNITI